MFNWLFKKQPNKYNIYYNSVCKELLIFDSDEETGHYLVEKDILLENISEKFDFWKNVYKVKQ